MRESDIVFEQYNIIIIWAGPTLINSITNHQYKTNWIMTKSIHRQGHYFLVITFY